MAELVWEGKYDSKGNRAAPLKVPLPFQTVETVNESIQERQRSLDLFNSGRDPEWRNRLIWGDKKYVLPALLDEFAGRVDLIYIDPPFATGADFSYIAEIPDDPGTEGDQSQAFLKQPSVIEQKAYRDTWGKGLDSYVAWFYEAVVVLRELLSEMGSIYVHLDWHVVHYAKAVLDEVFGRERFRAEIVWKRTTAHNDARTLGTVHDTILLYTRGDKWTWNPQYMTYEDWYVERYYRYKDPDGRSFMSADYTGAGGGPARRFGDRGVLAPPRGRHWLNDQEGVDRALAEGRIFWTKNGVPRLKRYLDESPGQPIHDVWTDVLPVVSWSSEGVGFQTQKPVALLARIIKTSSDEGGLVLDCFCGSGTTAVAAERLGRRWIAADLGRFAIHTTRKRLLSTEALAPFVVQNLGKYERQLWQASEFGEQAEKRTLAYRQFILDLYKAKPIEGYSWLHGVKAGAMVHVGTVDAPITVGDVKQVATEFRKAIGKGKDAPKTAAVDILGWDFAFELNEVAKQEAALASINMRFVRIPREVLDRRAVEQGDVHFYELAALRVDVKVKKRTVSLRISDFVIPLDDVPDDVQRAVKNWSQWVDYWAVDWNNKDDTFHNEWQTYRTKGSPKLEMTTAHEYESPGKYRIVVKVIDILGNDTTKSIEVEVK